jgi:hypothetical protein
MVDTTRPSSTTVMSHNFPGRSEPQSFSIPTAYAAPIV